jgi:membrane-associated protease RseP (regulator of RpoE activity)
MIGMYPPHKGDAPGTVREDSTGLFQQMSQDAKEWEAAQYDPAEQHRTFVALPVWKKLVVMLGGPTMNLLISALLLTVLVCGIGLPGLSTTVESVSRCVVPADAPADTSCDGQQEAPALAAGIEPGDRIVSIDGTEITSWDEITAAIRASGDRTIPVVVERDGKALTLEATPIVDARPVLDEDGNAVTNADGSYVTQDVGFLGISPGQELQRQSPLLVPGMVGDAFVGTAKVVVTLPLRLVEVGKAAFSSEERDPNGPIGVVGVSRLAGEITAADEPGLDLTTKVATLLSMMASLNMALFVFNLIPLLPLDGGHVLGAVIEGIRRWIARLRGKPDPGPVDMSRMLLLTNVVALFFVAMTVLLLYADVVKPVTLFP